MISVTVVANIETGILKTLEPKLTWISKEDVKKSKYVNGQVKIVPPTEEKEGGGELKILIFRCNWKHLNSPFEEKIPPFQI